MRPLPYAALRKFLKTEGWERRGTTRSPRGQRGGDHERYTLTLADGDVLYTRISNGRGQYDDAPLITMILRVQLRVTEADFWACVERGVLPPRPAPEQPRGPGEELDASLVRNLVRRVGLTTDEIAGLTREQAIARWQDFLTRGS